MNRLFIVINRRTRKAWVCTPEEAYMYCSKRFCLWADYLVAWADTQRLCDLPAVVTELNKNRMSVKKVQENAKR